MKLCFGVSSGRIQNVTGGSPFALEFYFFPVHREAMLSRKEGILDDGSWAIQTCLLSMKFYGLFYFICFWF